MNKTIVICSLISIVTLLIGFALGIGFSVYSFSNTLESFSGVMAGMIDNANFSFNINETWVESKMQEYNRSIQDV